MKMYIDTGKLGQIDSTNIVFCTFFDIHLIITPFSVCFLCT